MFKASIPAKAKQLVSLHLKGLSLTDLSKRRVYAFKEAHGWQGLGGGVLFVACCPCCQVAQSAPHAASFSSGGLQRGNVCSVECSLAMDYAAHQGEAIKARQAQAKRLMDARAYTRDALYIREGI